jgi:hypothetical protein
MALAATLAPLRVASTTSVDSLAGAPQQHAGDVPVALQRDYLIAVRGRVGDRRGLTVVVDTGTLPTLVDNRIARSLPKTGPKQPVDSFTRTDELDSVVIPHMAVGPFSALNVPALSADLSRLEPHFGVKIDVVMGVGVLRGTCFSIDYVGRRLSFACRQGWRATVPLERRSAHVVAAVTIDATPLRLLVDTGSPALLVYGDAAPAAWHSRVEADIEARDFSGPLHLRRLTADVITLGSLTWRRRPVYVLSGGLGRESYDGVLGVRALDVSAVQFDLQRMVLSWND